MDVNYATEIAYKNGYNAAVKELAKANNIYFITCFQKYEIDEFGWPDMGAIRTFGYYNDRDVAIKAVEINNLDIHECLYTYAVIECIPEGLYNLATERIFFKWNKDKKMYEEIEPIEDCFGNYAVG